MKIILSRKGFDSASGGCPSPILPDGRLAVLPIPDSRSSIRYAEISLSGLAAGTLVTDLTGNRLSDTDTAHLDPDLTPHSIAREPGWRPIFGQHGAAQGHLRNNRIGPGDLFLFYGLFRETEKAGGRYCWKKSAAARHILWGWLQVDEVHSVTPDLAQKYGWMSYHPHFCRSGETNNVLYLASRFLALPGCDGMKGSGVFTRVEPALVLSCTRQQKGASTWELPAWCHPRRGTYPLSYHARMDRWQRRGSTTLLNTVRRGQEFILDTGDYPEAISWAASLLRVSG